jgi:hypothetical protein
MYPDLDVHNSGDEEIFVLSVFPMMESGLVGGWWTGMPIRS